VPTSEGKVAPTRFLEVLGAIATEHGATLDTVVDIARSKRAPRRFLTTGQADEVVLIGCNLVELLADPLEQLAVGFDV
jgi:hypothetical protein